MPKAQKDGLSASNAIKLSGVGSDGSGNRAIYDKLAHMFGGKDLDYFVHNERTVEDPSTKIKYRILWVEDSFGKKRNVFFDITDWS